jgi:hypothetical protein
MADQGMAERLAASLREFVGRWGPARRTTVAVIQIRPVVHGMELGVEASDGSDRASVFVFDTGAIHIEADRRSPLREHLERWKEYVLETQ